MATTVEWKNLPADILSILAKLLNSDVDNLHLRSVCSSWRSSLPPPSKPLSFPLKLPPLIPPSNYAPSPIRFLFGEVDDIIVNGNFVGDFVLDEITLYRLSPPSHDDEDDSSNGWLLTVSTQTNSDSVAFTVLDPVTMEKMEDPIPKHVNLLDYRISEICKCHAVNFTGNACIRDFGYKKAIALWNYSTDCHFAALVLKPTWEMAYWRLGDKNWTPIHSNLLIEDVILYRGKCCAVYGGGLACLDSEWNQRTVSRSPIGTRNLSQIYLAECNSELYVVRWF